MTNSVSGHTKSFEAASALQGLRVKAESPGRRALRRFLHHRIATVGAIILIIMTLSAIGAPLISRYSPDSIDLDNRAAPPSWEHWLGTDRLGRDVWSRTIYGGRVSLAIGFSAAILTGIIGTVIGGIAGFLRGVVDAVVMRIVDVIMTIPNILVLLILVMYIGPGLEKLMIILPAMSWPGTARLMRGQVLQVREADYVMASRCLGYPNWRIMLAHVLPNAFVPVLVSVTMAVGGVIMSEAGLSFLGLGVMPPTSTWGNMLNQATNIQVLQEQVWMWLPPALLITLTTLCVNFVGDGLRDALDPRQII